MEAKVCLVGPQASGKTTIASRIDTTTVASQRKNATTTFANCSVFVGDRAVHLHILDVSGEEKLRCMGPIFCKGVQAALCVFDLSSEKSFDVLHSWAKCVMQNGSTECILMIIGNKADLDICPLTKENGLKLAESLGARYFEISAESGKGLLNAMVYVAKRLLHLNNCYMSYAAKLSIKSDAMGSSGRKEIMLKPRRLSFFSRPSLMDYIEKCCMHQ